MHWKSSARGFALKARGQLALQLALQLTLQLALQLTLQLALQLTLQLALHMTLQVSLQLNAASTQRTVARSRVKATHCLTVTLSPSN
jgi:hypothetical protein